MNFQIRDTSSLEDVMTLIRLGAAERFADIPVRFQSGAVAKVWLDVKINSDDLDFDAFYAQVPLECRTDEFMIFASLHCCNVLKDTQPSKTDIYYKLACNSVLCGYHALEDVHPDFREQILEFTFEHYAFEMEDILREVSWVSDTMSEDLFERCCHKDFKVAINVPSRRPKKAVCQYIDLKDFNQIWSLRVSRRLDLLAERIQLGDWPAEPEGMSRPGSLEEAVSHFLNPRTTNDGMAESTYMAFLMTFPMADVVPAMQGSRPSKLLTEMYSEEALQPYIKNHRGLKGLLLESALGL